MEAQVTRLYTGPDGESHFEDIKIPLNDDRGSSRRSEFMKATGIIFHEFNVKELDWHNAPCRQFAISLEGDFEVEVGDGTRRRFKAGDVILAEDTTGRGHISHLLDNPLKAIFVTLE